MKNKTATVQFLLIFLSVCMVYGSYKYVEFRQDARQEMCTVANVD